MSSRKLYRNIPIMKNNISIKPKIKKFLNPCSKISLLLEFLIFMFIIFQITYVLSDYNRSTIYKFYCVNDNSTHYLNKIISII